jgi:hypothetical protein
MSTSDKLDGPQGTLDLMILTILSRMPMHGYGISQRLLPSASSHRMIWDDASRTGGEPKFFSTPPEWLEWRRSNTVFTDIAASEPGMPRSRALAQD